MLAGVGRMNYRLVGWRWQSWDWVWFRKRTGDRIAGDIECRARADRRYTLAAVPLIIERLREDGYGFAPLCETGIGQ